MELFTANELSDLQLERRGWLNMQMPSFIRGDEEENAEDIFFMSIKNCTVQFILIESPFTNQPQNQKASGSCFFRTMMPMEISAFLRYNVRVLMSTPFQRPFLI